MSDLTELQQQALETLIAADDHRDQQGFVSQLAALDKQRHRVPLEQLTRLQELGLVELRWDGGPAPWAKVTARGRKAAAK